MSAITGTTRLLAIVGDPIAQAKSPAIFSARLARAAADAVLIPVHAPAAQFERVMDGLQATANLDGIVITYPFKQAATAYASRLDAMAERTGSVNALRREPDGSWSGGMFDGKGLARAAEGLVGPLAGRRVLLVGGGGAGGAIAHALVAEGVAALHLVERNADRAETLLAALRRGTPGCRATAGRPPLAEVDLVINATPVGLAQGDPLPLPLDDLTPETAVIDIVPRPDTELLRRAAAAGCAHIDGSAMVAGQCELILNYFRLL